jgi:hypothetical protein
MKRITTAALAVLMMLPVFGWAVAAPSGLAVSPWANSGSFLSWTNDPTATSWQIFISGNNLFSPPRSYVSASGTGRVGFQLTGISQASLPVIVAMKAISGGSVSTMSVGVTVTAVGPVPFTYVQSVPGAPLAVSLTGGGGGGDATAANQVIGNASLSSIDGKTVVVNTGAVSVSSSALPAGAATESSLSSLNGKVTVVNTGAISISSSVAIGLAAGTAYIGAVGVSNTVGTTNSGGVSVTNPATAAVQIAGSITNTVTVGTHAVTINSAPTGLAVNVSNTVNTTLQTAATGLAVNVSNTVATTNSGGVSVTNPATAAVQVAGSITNTVTVGTHAVTINSAATGLAVNVSNTVTVGTHAVTINSAATGLAVNVSNSATTAVQVAGSITNTVNVQGPVSATVAVGTNPVLFGGRAATTFPAAVADGALIAAQFTKSGKLVVMPQSIPELVTRTTTTISASTVETTVLALLASTFWDIDSISVINTDGTNNTRIDFRSATGGPVVFSMGAAKAFGGFVQSFPVPMPQDAVGTNWTAQCSVSTTDIRINIVAHQRK